MNYPKISIITPSFNQGQYIEQTILSVISQGYLNLEYIIIDGGSTDQTVDILKKYEKHLAGWVSEPDRGQSHAINKGLARATGEVFNWLNSDDLLAPGSLHAIGGQFSRADTRVLCGYCRIFEDQTGNTVRLDRMGIKENAEETVLNHKMNQPSTFFRLDAIRQLGGVNENLHFVMDLDLWIRYLLTHGLAGVKTSEEVLSDFRLHQESKTVGATTRMENEEVRYYHSLTNALDLPGGIKEVVQRKYPHVIGPEAQEELIANISRDSRHRLGRYLVKKYIGRLNHPDKRGKAREAVRGYYRYGGSLADKEMLKIAAKAFLVNGYVLSLYRKLKHSFQ
jgi:glycosyltransferase involved in cell wall biosynthesis